MEEPFCQGRIEEWGKGMGAPVEPSHPEPRLCQQPPDRTMLRSGSEHLKSVRDYLGPTFEGILKHPLEPGLSAKDAGLGRRNRR